MNIYNEIKAGLVVFLALLPEALGFTLIAGVDPIYGILSCFFMSLSTSLFGGRPGMISAAAGATALVLVNLVADYGANYLLYATLLAGVIQISLTKINFKPLLNYVSQPIVYGFLNGLGILMFISQLHNFNNLVLIILAIITLLIIKITKNNKVPSPIIALIVMTVLTLSLDVDRLGDMGDVQVSQIKFMLDLSIFNFNTFFIVLPYSLSVALIGLLESFLTANVVEEKIDDKPITNYHKITFSQGLGNILNGLFGGITGCGMIGQSIMNVNSGGRGRISIFMAGAFFILFAILIPNILMVIPLFSLSSIMLLISYQTFSLESIYKFNTFKNIDKLIIILTTLGVVLTHNLFIGVILGVTLQQLHNKFLIKKY